MSFLSVSGKTFLITGVANRKSVAWHIAKTLEEAGAKTVFSVRSPERLESVKKLLGDRPAYVCDVEDETQIQALAEQAGPAHGPFAGLVHSIAFANFSAGPQPFHNTRREDFLQATTISCFSLVELARAFKPYLAPDAAVVSIGISSQVTAENYGYLSPIKAALDSATRFLAKSFSADTAVRFNTVNPGPLKTSASAGIPGYLENYLFAEKLTLRKQAVTTQEVANTAVFLLSPRSSGINGQSIVVNAGMDMNYFDREVLDAAMRPKI
ncbi:SDR family oxidoreductase [Ruficoccus amylovorans]|uniref:Enoyl-[acyl-carrier-protein] reductase [NADH] n=1 Tax=Ruficoccus amylovorans TaxID=1804625 RepID=A0A842H9J7_9BACT|nr:SDR family oxidoreductase [Ruficoccus amylovorans]MBC2593183.1 SDR family oxidoreductase [Ruficoccus amylovorans]